MSQLKRFGKENDATLTSFHFLDFGLGLYCKLLGPKILISTSKIT